MAEAGEVDDGFDHSTDQAQPSIEFTPAELEIPEQKYECKFYLPFKFFKYLLHVIRLNLAYVKLSCFSWII